MPKQATVWAVHLGLPEEGTMGTLALRDTALSFSSERGDADFNIALASIRRVRRVRGSPVMIVKQDDGEMAVYFAQPPPLTRPDRSHPLERRRARARSMRYLIDTNRERRREVKAWVAAVKEALGRSTS